MRSKIVVLFAAIIAASWGYAADPFVGARGKCKVGDSLRKCRSQIQLRELSDAEVRTLLDDYPFKETHPFLRSVLREKRLVVWSNDSKGRNGWPLYVFGSFSPKQELADLIGTYEGHTTPLVPGTYDKNVRGIARGASVALMYELVGKSDADYFRGRDGKWLVRFTYEAYPGRFWVVEADAATGTITSAQDGTI